MICSKCGLEKTGANDRCLPCRAKTSRKYREKNYEKVRKQERERHARYMTPKKRQAERPAERRRTLKRLFGVDDEALRQMLCRQGALCRICREPPDCVDHCHRTGFIRGMLCRRCNAGLGQFRDSVKLLLAAVRYLKETEEEAQAPEWTRPRRADGTPLGPAPMFLKKEKTR